VTTKLAHVHEQSEFTYDGYLVAAGKGTLNLAMAQRGILDGLAMAHGTWPRGRARVLDTGWGGIGLGIPLIKGKSLIPLP